MELPPWIEKNRVSDAAIASAYENTPAAFRSAIKTGIAISHFQYGAADSLAGRLRSSSQLGLATRAEARPADWTLLFIGDELEAAARICALAILPRLAGVPNVQAVLVARTTRPALVTLELCGIEDIFATDLQKCARLLRYVEQLAIPHGRICFLHEGSLAELAHLPLQFAESLNLERRPRLFLAQPYAFNAACLEFCHGADIKSGMAEKKPWDAVFTNSRQDEKQFASRLYLAPGCEGFWSFPNVTPEFFLEKSLSVALSA